MKRIIPLCLLLIATKSFADDNNMKEGANYCHDSESLAKINKFLEENKTDYAVIKLVALRSGLCRMVDENKIPLDAAIDIFADEKTKVITERTNEKLRLQPKPVL